MRPNRIGVTVCALLSVEGRSLTVRGLDAIVGGDVQAARSWMTTENTVLGGTPAAMIATISGLMQTVQYVDARRARV